MAKKVKNKYVIRKIIEADSVEEAIKNEKKAKIAEVILISSDGKQLMPAVGFMANWNTEDDD